jgi:hypothetical protein
MLASCGRQRLSVVMLTVAMGLCLVLVGLVCSGILCGVIVLVWSDAVGIMDSIDGLVHFLGSVCVVAVEV